MPTRICFACNEDGFGPSAFAYYVVKGLLSGWRARHRKDRLEICIVNSNAKAFNHALHDNRPEIKLVCADSLIRLEKMHGEVHVAQSIERLSRYPEWRETYWRDPALQSCLKGCRIAIDIGVPLFARSASRAGVTTITFFDHSWARTIRGICSPEARYWHNPLPTEQDLERADGLAEEIECDERCAAQVIVFDRFITPPDFREHWERLGYTPMVLRGVLGSKGRRDRALSVLNDALKAQNQIPVTADQKLVLIAPGGTPVWDGLLLEMIREFVKAPREYLPILSRPNPEVVVEKYKALMRTCNGIRWIDFLPGTTQQAILPAFALVVTRAGGGIVNDCLASRTPFVCIEELQWQVTLIERECKALNLIPSLPETSFEAFERNPVGCIDRIVATPEVTPLVKIQAGSERDIAHFIISRL